MHTKTNYLNFPKGIQQIILREYNTANKRTLIQETLLNLNKDRDSVWHFSYHLLPPSLHLPHLSKMMEVQIWAGVAKKVELPLSPDPSQGLWYLPKMGRTPAFLIRCSSMLQWLNSWWMQLKKRGSLPLLSPHSQAEALLQVWYAKNTGV